MLGDAALPKNPGHVCVLHVSTEAQPPTDANLGAAHREVADVSVLDVFARHGQVRLLRDAIRADTRTNVGHDTPPANR